MPCPLPAAGARLGLHHGGGCTMPPSALSPPLPCLGSPPLCASLPLLRPRFRGLGQVPHARAAAPGTGLFLSTVGPGMHWTPPSRWDGQGEQSQGGQESPTAVCPPLTFLCSRVRPPRATHMSWDGAGAATRSRTESGHAAWQCRLLRPTPGRFHGDWGARGCGTHHPTALWPPQPGPTELSPLARGVSLARTSTCMAWHGSARQAAPRGASGEPRE